MDLRTEVDHVLNYLKRRQLEDPSFLYAMEEDSGNVFWADPTCRLNYTYFGDTLVFDTTYRRCKSSYQVPLVAFSGINHHGQPVLFGCALVFNESESSFVWLLQTWLQAMSAPPPGSITVEPDRLIQVAVSRVFGGQTRLRFSLGLIFRETEEKLAHVFRSHPSFESEFVSCVTETETSDEFEASWNSVVRRYYLEDNDWLQSIYNARQQWVPVFIRDTFYGELSSNEGSGILNSFFRGFVDESTTMQTILNQYEKAVDSWREKELKADYEATNSTPIMKTSSPMEKQAASLYTMAAFIKFQIEFVEALANPANRTSDLGTRTTTYRVANFGEVHKGHTVDFDSLEVKANCSCQMFEYSGIVCRHILAVFRANNVLTLPSRYLLRRWTKKAKTRGTEEQLEFSNGCQESLNVCYENLRQEATKYVEEGAKSIQSYKAAMDALDEASKKVAAANNKIRGATLVNGDSYQPEQETANAMNDPGGEKERMVHELTAELERTRQRCEVYRAHLLSILRDMEEQKFQLSLKVQNARLTSSLWKSPCNEAGEET